MDQRGVPFSYPNRASSAQGGHSSLTNMLTNQWDRFMQPLISNVQRTTGIELAERVSENIQMHPARNAPQSYNYAEPLSRAEEKLEKKRRKKAEEQIKIQDCDKRRVIADAETDFFRSSLLAMTAGSSNQIQVSASGQNSAMSPDMQKLILIDKPNVPWDTVIVPARVKEKLHNAVVMPLIHPHLFENNFLKPVTNILFYGPPGCGKTELARAVATEARGYTFFHVSSSDIFSKYVGDPEKKVALLFDAAGNCALAIIFIDEIDAICRSRGDEQADVSRRVLTEFLSRLDGIRSHSQSGIVFIGATNRPWDLDDAMLRRFQEMIYVGLPDAEAREKLFKLHLGKIPNTLTEEDFKTLGDNTHGFSGSDIKNIADIATGGPLQQARSSRHFQQTNDGFFFACDENEPGAIEMSFDKVPSRKLGLHPVTFDDVKNVILGRKPSVSTTLLDQLEKFHENHGH